MPSDTDTPGTAATREETSVSLRLGVLETQNVQVLGLLQHLPRQTALLEQLAGFASAKDAREQEALRIEKERSKASAEAQLRRLEAETAERRTANAWMREQAGKLVAPFPAFLTAVLGGLGILVIGYLSGRFGLPVPPMPAP